MLAIRNKLKRLFHSYAKLSFVSQHFVVTLAPFRLSFSQHYVYYFSPTLPLSFSHHCILISRPSVCHFSAIVFIFFPPFCLPFSRHCTCPFPAITSVIFPPLRSLLSCHLITFFIFPPLRLSVVTLPLFPPLHLSSRSSPSRLYVDHFFTWLPLRLTLSFSCHYVLHFSPKGLS